ncbi:hypothetical protein tinsulaeT_08020 [Thalassotalea insulae]|uniref:Outer membrane protein assembly factor BamE n=1 Tax=Thalassotalea insulae TaxID=2056778 RepID=A0ABQ6GS59_9GAMM|nr:outer membrane protein assembly factor BamE [Thalassotalea insulae]GLX77462.1 hypothetical protein tinsulaeT_08020 [Thalassotalea insulae]
MLYRVLVAAFILSISACSSWIYRIDIPQGNYLEQRDVDKLQIGMTKEQVKYVLGSPVVLDAFNQDTWHYVYRFKSGRSTDYNAEKHFVIKFADNKLISAEGDFTLSENFNTPMNNDQ